MTAGGRPAKWCSHFVTSLPSYLTVVLERLGLVLLTIIHLPKPLEDTGIRGYKRDELQEPERAARKGEMSSVQGKVESLPFYRLCLIVEQVISTWKVKA